MMIETSDLQALHNKPGAPTFHVSPAFRCHARSVHVFDWNHDSYLRRWIYASYATNAMVMPSHGAQVLIQSYCNQPSNHPKLPIKALDTPSIDTGELPHASSPAQTFPAMMWTCSACVRPGGDSDRKGIVAQRRHSCRQYTKAWR